MASQIILKVQYSDGGAEASLINITKLANGLDGRKISLKIDTASMEKLNGITAKQAREYKTAADNANKAAIAQAKVATETSKQELNAAKASKANAQHAKSLKDVSDSAKKAGDNLLESAGKLATWMLLGNAISGVKRAFTDALGEMKAVDTALVSVRKVTGATSEELEGLTQRAYEMGAAYGKSASEYLSAVSDFSRAGYKELAGDLGELALKTQLVGEVDAETATQFLLSVDAAYKYKGNIAELSKVLDGANEIDNKYATSIQAIAEGLGKVAPMAAMANVGVDELTAAIGTITAVTQRTGNEAATALRAIFMNIMGETTSEVEDGVESTKENVDAMLDLIKKYAREVYDTARATGTVINPMEGIGALAKAYQDGLLSVENILDKSMELGGKLRTTQLVALIQNWDMYKSMLADYGTAIGSSQKEVDNALDSWDVKSKRLTSTWTKLVSEFVETDLIKGSLDGLNVGLELLDTNVGKAAITGAAFFAMLSVGAKIMASLKTAFTGISVGSFGWIGVAVAGVTLLYNVIDSLVDSYDDLKKKSDDAQKKYEEEKSALESINTELETQRARMEELKGLGTLTYVEQAEFDLLKKTTEQLQIQADLKKKAVENAQKEAALAQSNLVYGYQRYDQSEVDRYLREAKMYGAEAIPATDLQNINALLAERVRLTQLYDEALKSGSNYADMAKAPLEELNKALEQQVQNLLDAQSGMQEYYDVIKDIPYSEMTNDQRLVYNAYNLAGESIKSIYKEIDPVKFAEIWGDTADAVDGIAESVDNIDDDKLKSLVDKAIDLKDELKGAQTALENFNKALEGGEKGDLFQEYAKVYERTMALYQKGLVGTKEYKAGVALLLGNDVMDEIGWDYEKAGELASSKFFASFMQDKEDYGTGGLEFLAKKYSKAGGEIVDANGDVVASVKKTKEGIKLSVQDWEGLADTLGVNVELLHAWFDALGAKDPNAVSNLDKMTAVFNALDSSIVKLVGRNKIVNMENLVNKFVELGYSKQDIVDFVNALKDMSDVEMEGAQDGVGSLIDKAVEAKNKQDELGDSDVKPTVDASSIDTAKDKTSGLYSSLQSLTSKKWKIQLEYSTTTEPSAPGTRMTGEQDRLATGTRNWSGGKALVNDGAPVNGSRAEIIVDKGEAFIPNNGQPTIVDLSAGAQVFSAKETQDILKGGSTNIGRIPSFAYAQHSDGAGGGTSSTTSVTPSPSVVTVPAPPKPPKKSGGSSSSSGSSSSTSSAPTADDYWSIVEEYVNYGLQLAQAQINAQERILSRLKKQMENALEPVENQIKIQEKASDAIDRQITQLERAQRDTLKPLQAKIDALDNASKAIEKQTKALTKARDAALKPLDAEIEALEKAKETKSKETELAERQLAIEEARAALQNAQESRTVRIRNAATGQWEWTTDPNNVKTAQKSLETAEKALADFLEDLQIYNLKEERERVAQTYDTQIEQLDEQNESIKEQSDLLRENYDAIKGAYEDQIELLELQQEVISDSILALKDQKEAIEERYEALMKPVENTIDRLTDVYDDLRDRWDAISLAVSLPTENLSSALTSLSNSGLPAFANAIANVRALLNSLAGYWPSSSTGSQAFDDGGLAQGLGVMPKKTVHDEIVVGPELTKAILSPSANDNVSAFMNTLGIMYGTGKPETYERGKTSTNATTTYNTGASYYINGMQIGAREAESMSIRQALSSLPIHS